MKRLIKVNIEDVDKKTINTCNKLSNDLLFFKYDVNVNDIFEVIENQTACLIYKGYVLDIKKDPGIYVVKDTMYKETDEISNIIEESNLDKESKEALIKKAENSNLCLVFINTGEIISNKYYINDPIKFLDFQDNKYKKIHITLEGLYNFQIVDTVRFLSRVIGLRTRFSKVELIEQIRRHVLHSIEFSINEIASKYKLNIGTITEKSKELEVSLSQNASDKKLLEYGIKMNYFDISKFEISKKRFKILKTAVKKKIYNFKNKA